MVQEQQTDIPQQQPGTEAQPSTGETAANKTSEHAAARESTPGQVPEESTEEGAAPEQLTALLEDARAKADEHWDQLLRARAEVENLKRRQARELENAHKYALDGFVRELLQVRDSLELGQDAARDEATDVDKLREGTELTLKLLSDVMTKFGVERLDPEGEPFNPEFHQAMTTQPHADVPPNSVVTVVQKGYLLNGRLVRPAMVIVSRGE